MASRSTLGTLVTQRVARHGMVAACGCPFAQPGLPGGPLTNRPDPLMLDGTATDDASARLAVAPARRTSTARPAPVHRSDPGPFVAGGPSGPGGRLLLLQRQAGNAAVQTMLGPTDEVTVARQRVAPGVHRATARLVATAGAGGAAVALNGATPLVQAADGFTQATPAALDQAWGLLHSRAMFDLLPMLAGLKTKGFWSVITADATPGGGPRMANAVHTVDLKT